MKAWPKTILPGSLVFFGILFFDTSANWGHALADDFCVQFTTNEFNQSRQRNGKDNACEGDRFSNPVFWARDRARDNANAAIEPQCVNNISLAIARHACTRANLVVNTAGANFWGVAPPTAKPAANKVRYLGHGIGGAATVNLCAAATDTSISQQRVRDGGCDGFSQGFPGHRVFVTAHARARCGIVCSTP
jgi:hypothetical protein